MSKRKFNKVKIVLSGAGAAGTAIAKKLLRCGARNLVVCDRRGILHSRRRDLNENGFAPDPKCWLARHTNPQNLRGSLEQALRGADVFIGVSGPALLNKRAIKRMARNPILFALANPLPEIMPDEAKGAFIVATGRSDYPNQINNVLAFPGIFRGALNARARRITEPMTMAAARAIARCIHPRDLAPDLIVPSALNPGVVQRVAAAVHTAAVRTGVARVNT